MFGLGVALAAEVEAVLGAKTRRRWCEVEFPFGGDVERLLQLRVPGNVFLLLDRFTIGRKRPDLARLADHLHALPMQPWEQALAAAGATDLADAAISVQVSRKGDHNYRYMDIEEVACDTLATVCDRRATLDDALMEMRIRIVDDECRIMGRVTPRPLSHRSWKARHMPAETDPCLAAAMVRLSTPKHSDVFLDPFCGTGTIAIERALTMPAKRILAGDIKPKCIGWAEKNIENAEVAVELNEWDAFALPLEDRIITRLVTNPPQSNPADGRPWAHDTFTELLRECLRVTEYGGRHVWLLRDEGPIRTALDQLPNAHFDTRMLLEWKGRPCTAYVIEKSL
jgi:tRNA (guanine6-N2)-methyltransferase